MPHFKERKEREKRGVPVRCTVFINYKRHIGIGSADMPDSAD